MTTLAGAILLELIRKSGVREYEDANARAGLIAAANEMAQGICEMLPDYQRVADATAITFKSSSGSATITLASLANSNDTSTGGRGSTKYDFGATRPELYNVHGAFEMAATPTARATIDLHWAPSTSGTAGTDNPGGVSGTDAAYAGYRSNLLVALGQCLFIGSFSCTSQVTGTVQKAFVATFRPPTRYGSLVVHNRSGAAIHSSDTNCVVTFTPTTNVIEET